MTTSVKTLGSVQLNVGSTRKRLFYGEKIAGEGVINIGSVQYRTGFKKQRYLSGYIAKKSIEITAEMKRVAHSKKLLFTGEGSATANRIALAAWLALGAEVTVLSNLTCGFSSEKSPIACSEPFRSAIRNGQLKLMSSQQFSEQLQRVHN